MLSPSLLPPPEGPRLLPSVALHGMVCPLLLGTSSSSKAVVSVCHLTMQDENKSQETKCMKCAW